MRKVFALTIAAAAAAACAAGPIQNRMMFGSVADDAMTLVHNPETGAPDIRRFEANQGIILQSRDGRTEYAVSALLGNSDGQNCMEFIARDKETADLAVIGVCQHQDGGAASTTISTDPFMTSNALRRARLGCDLETRWRHPTLSI
ncbi:MAG: hypothetical protein AB7G06_08990 [Bdellovibrionales bacterium]